MKQSTKLPSITVIILLATMTLMLTSCVLNNNTSQNQSSEPTKKSKVASSKKLKKISLEDDKDTYAPVFEDYQKILQYRTNYQTDLSHIRDLLDELPTELNYWVVESIIYNPLNLQYSFLDINQDGNNELLIGYINQNQQISPIALYYSHKFTPTLFAQSFVAGQGGARSNFTIYQNGDIVTTNWSSGTGAGTATLYQFSTDSSQPKQNDQTDFQIGEDIVNQLFGKSKTEEFDLSVLSWESFDLPQKTVSATDIKSMNINAIINNDFSSLAGTWKNGKSQVLNIKADGTLTYLNHSDTPYYVSVSGATIKNGQLYAGITSPNALASGTVPTFFIPKGVAITQIADSESDPTDKTRDRLFSAQYVMPEEDLVHEVFYRIEE